MCVVCVEESVAAVGVLASAWKFLRYRLRARKFREGVRS
jgi:hypothetical protein